MTDDPTLILGSPAPQAVALVRDFVNTIEWEQDRDTWISPSDLEAWFADRARAPVSGLRPSDVVVARRIREGLRSMLLRNAGHEPLAASMDDFNEALGAVPMHLRAAADGTFTLGAERGSGIIAGLATVLDAVAAAQGDGSWPRLKACSRDECRWAYYDGSRNSAARWCSMAGCGNYVKMLRRNSGEDAAEAELVPTTRVATLVDVAMLADVSIKTASNVVTGAVRVAAPTRARVERAIVELGYVPNLAARALRRARVE